MKFPIILLLVFLFFSAGITVIPEINSAQAFSGTCHNTNGGGSLTVTCQISTISGHFLVMAGEAQIGVACAGISSSESDSFASTWVQDVAGGSGFVGGNCYYTAIGHSLSAANSGTDTFTFTISGTTGANVPQISIQVYDDGIQSVGAVSTSTDSVTNNGCNPCTSLTDGVTSFTQGNLLTISAWSILAQGAGPGVTAGSGFTLLVPSPCDHNAAVIQCSEYNSNPSGATTIAGTISQGSARIVANKVSASFASSTVTMNLMCQLKETGATTETGTLSGASVSPTNPSCSSGNSSTSLTCNTGGTVTFTVQADGSNSRYRFNSSATSRTTQTFTCTASSTVQLYNYYQLENTYAASTNGNGPPTWDLGLTAVVSGTSYGGTNSSACTISPSSGTTATASCNAWLDYNTAASEPSTMSGAASNIQWLVSGIHSWTDTTGGNTHTGAYYKQVKNSFVMIPTTPSTWDSAYSEPLTGTSLGASGTSLGTFSLLNAGGAVTVSSVWSDYNTAVKTSALFASVPSPYAEWTANASSFTLTTGGGTKHAGYTLAGIGIFITIETNPTNLHNGFYLNGTLYSHTVTFNGVAGRTWNLTGAVKVLGPGAIVYSFSSWSDSGARSHLITVPGSNTTYIATFSAGGGGGGCSGTPFQELQEGCWLPAIVNWYSNGSSGLNGGIGLSYFLAIVIGDIDIALFLSTRSGLIAGTVFTVSVAILGFALPGVFPSLAYFTLIVMPAAIIYKGYTLRS